MVQIQGHLLNSRLASPPPFRTPTLFTPHTHIANTFFHQCFENHVEINKTVLNFMYFIFDNPTSSNPPRMRRDPKANKTLEIKIKFIEQRKRLDKQSKLGNSLNMLERNIKTYSRLPWEKYLKQVNARLTTVPSNLHLIMNLTSMF